MSNEALRELLTRYMMAKGAVMFNRQEGYDSEADPVVVNARRALASLPEGAADSIDAKRWRWVRGEATWADAGDGDIKWVFWVPMGLPDPLTPGKDLDAAIDEATKP